MNGQRLDDCDIVEQIAESFITRLRAGEKPTIEDYVARYPDSAETIRDVVPALLLLEAHASALDPDRPPSDTNRTPAPASHIDGFRIVREIGRGGMGVVYEAVEESLGRRVALKVLPTSALLIAKNRERFRFEARAAARLQHPNIVPVYGVGEVAGLQYYTMQYIEGQSLHEVFRELCHDNDTNTQPSCVRAPVSFSCQPGSREFYRRVAQIGLQVAEALSYAHSEGLLHRDIKPSNLLIDGKGNVWVADFGLAKADETEGLTETGDFVGTLRYMAPERLEGGFDRRSDIYSLGATLYEFVTLKCFFDTTSQARLIEKILHETPDPPSRVARSVPRDFETIILKTVAKEPGARYRNAEELAEDLRRFLADRPILATRPSTTEHFVRWCRRNPMVASLAGAVAGLLVAAIIILTRSNSRIRAEVAAKDQALASARGAVHQLLTRVAGEKLSDVARAHPLRVQLLEDAVNAYEELIALGDEDFAVQAQMAEVLHTIAGLQRELGHTSDAASSLQRSAKVFQSLVAADPDPPHIREMLAMVEADLAYTWHFDTDSPPGTKYPVEAQYRRALERYEGIERDYPDRPQPVTLSLRYLAEFVHRRGDSKAAEELWLQSIDRGERYLERVPDNIHIRTDLCWACCEYHEAILIHSPDRAHDGQRILAQGVKHAQIMHAQNPKSNEAIDVLASLLFRQALAFDDAGDHAKAVSIFADAIPMIEALCESVPWSVDYWNSSRWFHEESLRRLHNAGRSNEADASIEHTLDWLNRISEETKSDDRVQKLAAKARSSFQKLLQTLDRSVPDPQH